MELLNFFKYLESVSLSHPNVNQVLRGETLLSNHIEIHPPIITYDMGVTSYYQGYWDVSLNLWYLDLDTATPTTPAIQDDTVVSNYSTGVQVLRDIIHTISLPIVSESYQPAKYPGSAHLSGCLCQITFHIPASYCWDTI